MIDTQCPECEFVGDMRVVGEDGGYLEAKCPRCGASSWERTN